MKLQVVFTIVILAIPNDLSLYIRMLIYFGIFVIDSYWSISFSIITVGTNFVFHHFKRHKCRFIFTSCLFHSHFFKMTPSSSSLFMIKLRKKYKKPIMTIGAIISVYHEISTALLTLLFLSLPLLVIERKKIVLYGNDYKYSTLVHGIYVLLDGISEVCQY